MGKNIMKMKKKFIHFFLKKINIINKIYFNLKCRIKFLRIFLIKNNF